MRAQNARTLPPVCGAHQLRPAATTLLAGVMLFLVFAAPAFAQEHAPDAAPASPHAEAGAATGDDALVHRGTGSFLTPPPVPPPPPASNPGAPKLDLDFDHAPVAEVVETLLSSFANASVVVDPRVEGEITIQSHGQLSAAELPHFLQTNLAAIGLDLVEQAPNAYLLRPLASANDASRGADVYQPGQNVRSGLVIYGLRHVSAAEMTRLLTPLAHQGVTIQPEPNRELLILSGPADQVQSLVQTMDLLDVDWLDGISFGIVPVTYADPDALIGDLRTLFGGPQGPIGTMVEFVAMPDRRAILVLAKRPERLDQARVWISQLDRPVAAGSGRIRLMVLTNADASKIAETLSTMFGQGDNHPRIGADVSRNALIIDADPATFDEIAAIVHQLDQPLDQVMIEVTIAEVTLNNDFRFGVQWDFDLRDGSRAVLSEADGGGVVAHFPGFAGTYHGNYVDAALNALSSRTNVEVISKPVVVTLDNKQATLQVGDQVPIVTQSAANVTTPNATVVNTVEYRDTGVVLQVTPHISGNAVTLEITQEASEVAQTTTSGIDSPTIQQRRFQSTVSVTNGQTVALGGLIRASRTRTRAGLPVLGAIPLLGAAFGNTNHAVRRTELLVFLTPRILHSAGDAAQATNDLSQRLDRVRRSAFIAHAADH